MNRTIVYLLTTLLCTCCCLQLQAQDMTMLSAGAKAIVPDSLPVNLIKLAPQYLAAVDKKINKYNTAVTSKIEKTLTRLAKWENKIKNALEKADPPTATRLFGNNQTSFTSLLQKYRESKKITDDYTAQFSHYRDKLNTQVNYLQTQQAALTQKGKNPGADTLLVAIKQMNEQTDNAEYLETFIKERRKQLIDEAYKLVGKSRYFTKLNKESYYYIESLRNYKTILSDAKKTEELVARLLQKIPAFKEFAAQNSQLSGVFPSLSGFSLPGNGGNIPIVNGLVPRADVQQLMTNSGMNAALLISQLQGQTAGGGMEMSALTNKLEEAKETLASLELPKLKVNTQKTKTFRQRIETDLDLDFGKSNNFLPATANTGLMIGYKLSDKQTAGIGLNYKLGLGNGWKDIRFSNEGLGLRTYVRWKMKYNIYLQANGEWTYMLRFNNIEVLKERANWQAAALGGISKSYKISKKIRGNFQLLYNFLHNRTYPYSQPLVIRMGYGL